MPTEVSQNSLLFQQVRDYAAKNSELYPYVKDYFQETKPVMKAIKAFSTSTESFGSKLLGVGSAVLAQGSELVVPTSPSSHAKFEVLRVQSADSPVLKSRYLLRKAAMKFRIGKIAPDPVPAEHKQPGTIGVYSVPIIDRSINECMLFLGHTNEMIDTMCTTGARPDLGHYDPDNKGHGALGRGAYLTDRVDKAITYSPCPLCGQTGVCVQGCAGRDPDPEMGRVTRTILLCSVLLGYSMRTEVRGDFRHANLNELVRNTNYQGLRQESFRDDIEAANPPAETLAFRQRERIIDRLGGDPNKTRDEGQAAPNLPEVTLDSNKTPRTKIWDSMFGAGTYTPGGSAVVAALNRTSFDSDEYLVRNADQILPTYVIHYRIVP